MTVNLESKMDVDRLCRRLLYLLIAVSVVSHLPNLLFGFPEIVIRDEVTYAGAALEMLQKGTFDPGEYRYGNFIHYFYAAVFSLFYYPGLWFGFYESPEKVTPWHFYLIARVLSILCSVACLVLNFMVGRRLLGPLVALIGCVFLAVNPDFHIYSEIGKLDIYVVLVGLLAAWLFLNILDGSDFRKTFRVLGVLAGWAMAVKYSNVALTASLVPIFFILRKRVVVFSKQPLSMRILIETLLIAGVVFFLFCPYLLINHAEVKKQFIRQYTTTVQGVHLMASVLTPLRPWHFLTVHLPGAMGWFLAILSIPAWLYGYRLKGVRWVALTLHPLIHYALVNQFKFGFSRELLPLYPPLCLAAALALTRIGDWCRKFENPRLSLTTPVLVGLCVVSLYHPANILYHRGAQMYRGDTKVEAKKWFVENIPPGVRIGRESHVLPMKNTHPDEVFVNTLGMKPYEYYVDQDCKFLIKSRLDDRIKRDHPDVAANDLEIEQRAVLLKSINKAELGMWGMDIRIYRVPENFPDNHLDRR